jgi:hypothetical protein
MDLATNQSGAEISTRNFPGAKGLAPKVDILSAVNVPLV